MYHTRCTCLVNGIKTTYFMVMDLQEILNIIQSNLSSENTNLTEVNSKIRRWLLDYCQDSNTTNQHTATATASASEPKSSAINVHSDNSNLSTLLTESFEGSQNEEIIKAVQDFPVTIQVSPVTVHDAPEVVRESSVPASSVTSMLQQLVEDVRGLKTTLQDHIDNTVHYMNTIRLYDEISSVKKVCALHVKNAEQKVDTLTDQTAMVQNELKQISDTSLRRFKSISDQLQTLNVSRKRTTNKRTTFNF